ncbi:MAG: hypothetical protein LAN37_01030 [Acidobacteriia bacterium]|nr:hypothetical protein [Terriglobia bacterium]
MKTCFRLGTALAVAAIFCFAAWNRADAGRPARSDYRVLAPITQGNLTIFPVVASTTYDTSKFITLDEGLRSGDVVVTELGNVRGMIRPRPGHVEPVPHRDRGAEVNRLVLVNNSNRPLLLLAGEIVTGGKQDRVIGKDRIVPAQSDPLDMSVFCVEPGRWTATSDKFGGLQSQMAQPAIRSKAMGDKNQQMVWDEVHKSQAAMARSVPAPAAAEVNGAASYAGVMSNEEVKKQVDSVAIPVQRSYDSVIRQLRAQNAVGVVVAVNGQIIWADLFASTSLLEKYWPKLVRSYAAEAVTTRRTRYSTSNTADAQDFLEDFEGLRQTVETEPGVYRHTEIAGKGFRAFALASLLPKTGFDLHISKMAE